MSVKERLKESAIEIDKFLAYQYQNVLTEWKELKEVEIRDKVTSAVTAEVTSAVTAEKEAEAAKKIQTIVLHLYHDMGFSFIQISKTVDLGIEEVQSIINASESE